MPHFEICYSDGAGNLIGTYSAPCAGEKQARILAHAMRLPGTRRIEVWEGANLIYERPPTQNAVAIGTLRTRAELHAAG
jgi:hypothetical protein